ncbi:hypothetical protein EC990816_1121, partial [Escherichia coli 99.0816]
IINIKSYIHLSSDVSRKNIVIIDVMQYAQKNRLDLLADL